MSVTASDEGGARLAGARARFAGLPLRPLLLATGIAVLLGVAFALSPLGATFVLLLPLLFRWGARGLEGRERLWVGGVLGAAVAVRLAALLVFFLLSARAGDRFGMIQLDEEFIKRASLWLQIVARGDHDRMAPSDLVRVFFPEGQSGFLYVAGFFQMVFGPAPYAIHLINVVLLMSMAIMLHRLTRAAFGPLPALGGLVLMLFLPSLFVWSISAIKEPTYHFLSAAALVAAAAVFRAGTLVRRTSAIVVLAAMLPAITTIRPFAGVVTAAGLGAGLYLRTLFVRGWLTAVLLSLALVGGATAVRYPSVQGRLMRQILRGAEQHRGHVHTPGYPYKLLDPHFYLGGGYFPLEGMNRRELGRFLVRSAVSFVAVPLPWQAASPAIRAFLPQQVLWYALVALACIGVLEGLRRDALLTCLLTGSAASNAAVIALSGGNIGTLVRMRDGVTIMVVWLAALGACVVAESVTRRAERIRRRPAALHIDASC